MSIPRLALKTAALFALITAPVRALPQRSLASGRGAVAGVATSIVLTISTPLPASYGEDVGGYALVTSSDGSTLSGTVTFLDGATNICTIPVTQTTDCPASAGSGFATGTHMLTAVYSGDAGHQGSTSNGVPVAVLPDVTTISLTSGANPSMYGQSVALTATARGDYAVPSGQIEFFDAANLVATATLNPVGVATISAPALMLGTHSIKAVYAATQNFGAATSAVLSQSIQASGPAATVTTLASNANPASSGQSVTFAAQVVAVGQSLVPTGTVTFLDGSTTLGMATLNGSGVTAFSTASLAPGSHAISAHYAGDAVMATSSSTSLTEVVNSSSATGQAPFALTVAGSPTVAIGSAANLLVTVAPQTGFVQPVQLSCADLPSESACTFGTATLPANGGTTSLQISAMFPHSCASDAPYTQNTKIPFAGPALAGLLLLVLPRRRRRSIKSLLMVLVAVCGMASLMGCGNCTDLGTRPGDYTIKVVGTAMGTTNSTVIAKIALHVTLPSSN